MIEVTFFENSSAVDSPQNCAIEKLFECIRIGGKDGRLRDKVELIRQTADPDIRRSLKRTLPCIMWQGTFSYRNNASIVSLSGLMCIDIDHGTPEGLSQLRCNLMNEPWVVALFTSPSGDGMKVIVRTDNYDIAQYKIVYKQLEQMFFTKYGVKSDTNCEALSQGCFASYDPNIYVNLSATPLHLDCPVLLQQDSDMCSNKKPWENKPLNSTQLFCNHLQTLANGLSDEKTLEILDRRFSRYPDNYKDGHRTKSIFCQATVLCKAGIKEDDAIKYLKVRFCPTGYQEDKLEYEASRAYTKNKDAFGSERSNFKDYYHYKNRL